MKQLLGHCPTTEQKEKLCVLLSTFFGKVGTLLCFWRHFVICKPHLETYFFAYVWYRLVQSYLTDNWLYFLAPRNLKI